MMVLQKFRSYVIINKKVSVSTNEGKIKKLSIGVLAISLCFVFLQQI